eukprot:CAMPEP_0181093490 /NCGR_PEP_ID=MMETSP1071-20121207/9475_1 /TAXON_ID=35127 /ORGANISM="Thalassiosira sp., Strain NH16" /LENGTH=238 /DNA_ID=CAMNT_0023175731 /DNA_START=246 /DNA_END=962 /DNA_ORIENTATION=+
MMSCDCANAWSFEKAMVNWVKSSQLFADLHREHVSSRQAVHMMKSTPLVDAPDEAKMDFANGPLERTVANMMESEQALLGDWKLGKIVEAAGEHFDETSSHLYLLEVLDRAPVTLVSFADCPWCLLAKKLMEDEYQLINGDGTLQIIELEDLERDGKTLRAAIAIATGRTSMPACFVRGKSVGGYTDGFITNAAPDGDVEDSGFTYVPTPDRDLRYTGSPGLAKLHGSGELATLLGGM